MMPDREAKKFHIVSLGCPKNLVDSEVMAGILMRRGFRLTTDAREAGIIIINTCAFILPAKEEAIEAILTAATYKKTAACHRLIVAGCLPQRHGAELARAIPEVDLFIGTAEVPHIAEHLTGMATPRYDGPRVRTGRPDFLMHAGHPRRLMTPSYTAYLKIAEGCGNSCSYCIIPNLRGPARSRTPEDIVAEARKLVGRGVKELILIAQDTTAYGRDLPDRPSLTGLLRELAALEELVWIRLLYSHPAKITPELIRILNGDPKICPYLDMPIQHIDDEILGAMNRRGNGRKIRSLLKTLRAEGPDIALRTSLIVGFPGETKKKFSELMDFVRTARFDHLGVFPYYREEGTAAAALPARIPAAEKERRRELIMDAQADISGQLLRRRLDTVETVLIEGKSGQADYPFVGRTRRQAPEIDGITFVRGRGLRPGRFVSVRITAVTTYDLFGEVVDN
ncbi:MAG TPA: 30S ribosomal protein S12 methylthiotransferase RimO [Syntrophales bacterium]|jgi:ribosomal protein S12 methylthiotransferase|nr:30S ribosomal protein S12 methylthiotransferase RimO [Syntrophales bacterium]HOD98619.1 30S ribosomal protein S12 methylthiotransferase RimO [Syntrophales bacterium]HOH73369.1 30S ribosomal protein S12 methylthiotransferase RimO [Syntrophales bacterium]HPN07663.1 30S ribosomal protein S12 methylthiotransferase RimO [Syntrophales bacterium]HPX80608.1 30S ribosomal protein S12 methylthiotransferase RimO [Syntrophales bacterium]